MRRLHRGEESPDAGNGSRFGRIASCRGGREAFPKGIVARGWGMRSEAPAQKDFGFIDN
jgi:hypothetical protein